MSTRDRAIENGLSRPRRLSLSQFLPYRLNVAAAVVSDGLARAYSERFGISVHEWRILATLGEFHSITAKAIGEHAHMGKVSVSRAAASLKSRGLIRRTPNPHDKREAFLVFSSTGRALYDEIVPLALTYVDKLRDGWSAEEEQAFFDLLDRLVARAAALAAEMGPGGTTADVQAQPDEAGVR